MGFVKELSGMSEKLGVSKMPTGNPLLVRGVQVSTDVLRALFVVNVDRTLGEGVHWRA